MRYRLKERVFSLGGAFDITDASGETAFTVQGQLISLGKSLNLRDSRNQLLAHIQQRLLAFTPTYEISRNGELALTVHKQAFSWTPRFEIEGPRGLYFMEGDWTDWNFQIESGGQVVAWISRQFAPFADCYGVDIAEGADDPLILCLAIVMDEIIHDDQNTLI